MQNTPGSFSNIDDNSIVKMEHIGRLEIPLTPAHCDNLMQSGLVEMIILDVDVQINSLKRTSTI